MHPKGPLWGLSPKGVPRFSSCLPPRTQSHPTLPDLSSRLFWRDLFPNASRQGPCRQTGPLPSVHYLLSSTSLSYLPQTRSGLARGSTASVRLPELPFLPRVRGRPDPSLFHSKSSLSLRTPGAEKETET